MKHTIALLLSLVLAVSLLAACGGNAAPAAASTESPAPATAAPAAAQAPEPEEEDDENYDTGDASLDDPLNADGIGETELLVVSFGTSFNDSRRETIGAIEQAMIAAFPELDVRRGFTSQIIIDHVLRRDNEKIDNITEALDRAVANGVRTLIVQPTHLMDGFEYHDVADELAQYADAFDKIAIGRPILDTEQDFERVAHAIVDATKDYDDGETAIVFMGHGTEADSNAVYAKMQEYLTGLGNENYFIGTVEATPSVDDVLDAVLAAKQDGKNYKKVVLEPLMIVAGDHANNDMAGDDEDSWKNIFLAAGYDVTCVLRGLGSFPEIQELLVSHAREAIDAAAK